VCDERAQSAPEEGAVRPGTWCCYRGCSVVRLTRALWSDEILWSLLIEELAKAATADSGVFRCFQVEKKERGIQLVEKKKTRLNAFCLSI